MSNTLLNSIIHVPMPITPITFFDNTVVENATGTRQQVFSNIDYDRKTYALNYSALNRTERDAILNFYMTMKGSYDTFLFHDPTRDVMARATIGTGTGSEDEFQIIQNGFDRWNIEASPTDGQVWVNSVLQTKTTHYAIDYTDSGIIDFTFNPGNGHLVEFAGNILRRYRFIMDDGFAYTEANLQNISATLMFREVLLP